MLQVSRLSNGSASRIQNNLKQSVQNRVFKILFPDEYVQREEESDAEENEADDGDKSDDVED